MQQRSSSRLSLASQVLLFALANLLVACQPSSPATAPPTIEAPPPSPTPEFCVPGDEVCDGIDNDCDVLIDEGFDADADGWTTCGGDCQDGDPLIHPGVVELCDGQDNDCDGALEPDSDGDGTADCLDCADEDPEVSPTHPEVAGNGIDDDCDSWTDESLDIPWSQQRLLGRQLTVASLLGSGVVPAPSMGGYLTAMSPGSLLYLPEPDSNSAPVPPELLSDIPPWKPCDGYALLWLEGINEDLGLLVLNQPGFRPPFCLEGQTPRVLLGQFENLSLGVDHWYVVHSAEGSPGGAVWVDSTAATHTVLIGHDRDLVVVDLESLDTTVLPGPSLPPGPLQILDVLGGCDLDGNGFSDAIGLLDGGSFMELGLIIWPDWDQVSAPEPLGWVWEPPAPPLVPYPFPPFAELTCLRVEGNAPDRLVLVRKGLSEDDVSAALLSFPNGFVSQPLGYAPPLEVVAVVPALTGFWLTMHGACSPGDLNGDGVDDFVGWRSSQFGGAFLLDGERVLSAPGDLGSALVSYWGPGGSDSLDSAYCDRDLGRVYFAGKTWDPLTGAPADEIHFWP